MLERAGHIDHLVNNAGIGGNGVVEETTPERLAEVFDVDVIGAVRCAQAVLPHMRERGSGTIVNVTSVAGRIGAIAQAPYVAAKWALEGLSEQLALEVASFGIRVAIIEPGITKSSIFGKNTDAPTTAARTRSTMAGCCRCTPPATSTRATRSRSARSSERRSRPDTPKLRWPVSWGGAGITQGRAAMSDEDWVAMGLIESREDYMAEFQRRFSIDIST